MLEQDIKHWFAEDIGDGDHTTLCCIPSDAIGRSRLIVKDTGVIAGIEVAKKVFEVFDKEFRITQYIHDGDEVNPQDVAFEAEGKVRSLLQTERLMLNIMQRMSGSGLRGAGALRGGLGFLLHGCSGGLPRATTGGLRSLFGARTRGHSGFSSHLGTGHPVAVKRRQNPSFHGLP